MNNYFNKFFLLLIISVFIAACGKNFLKEKPTSFLSPENSFDTKQTARLALDGVYESLQDRGWDHGPYGFLLTEMLATDINKSFAGSTNSGLGYAAGVALDPEASPRIYKYNYAKPGTYIVNLLATNVGRKKFAGNGYNSDRVTDESEYDRNTIIKTLTIQVN